MMTPREAMLRTLRGERSVRAAFEGGSGRFVLRATEGPSPVMSEREFRNWMRMIDVWEELSGRELPAT